MTEGTSRDKLRRYLPDDFEIDKALEAALKEEEARTSAPLVGPELATLHQGSITTGRILSIVEDRVIVDISYKAEGVISLEEFRGRVPAPGEKVEVVVVRLEDENGQVALSMEEARRRHLWNAIASGDKTATFRGKVLEAVKGGLIVDVGVRAFLPAREVDLHYIEDLTHYVGKEVEGRILEADPVHRRVVISRRLILAEERAKKREALFATLAPGQSLKGTVTSVTDFGAFVDLGGAEGLIHKGDLAWCRVNHPSEILKTGQEVQVVVLTFERHSGKVSLGLKQAGPSPWDTVPQRYGVGRRAKGKVVGLLDFGAVFEFEPGVQGLCHISEMSWARRVRNPAEVVALGQEIEVEVIGLDMDRRKIGVSIKRVEENPWATLDQRYPYATIVHGAVSELADFGAFIRLDDGVEGLVHISELSWTKRYKHPSEMLKLGDKVTAIVIGTDQERQRLSLSLRATEPDPWWDVQKKYPPGRAFPGVVSRLESFGAFVRLEEGVEGLVHISRMGEGRVHRPQDVVKPGDKVTVEVLEANEEGRKISLRLVEVVE